MKTKNEIFETLERVSQILERSNQILERSNQMMEESNQKMVLHEKKMQKMDRNLKKMRKKLALQEAKRKAEREEQEAKRKAEREEQEAKYKAEFEALRKETEMERRKTEKKTRELENLFTGQWGKLIESLVEGEIIKLLQEKGINVKNLFTRSRNQNGNYGAEYDIVAIDGNEIVVVEVKTTLQTQHIPYFKTKLNEFKTWFPAYQNYNVYGAVAFLREDSHADLFAERQGLFVIRATGNSAKIINKDDFKPQIF